MGGCGSRQRAGAARKIWEEDLDTGSTANPCQKGSNSPIRQRLGGQKKQITVSQKRWIDNGVLTYRFYGALKMFGRGGGGAVSKTRHRLYHGSSVPCPVSLPRLAPPELEDGFCTHLTRAIPPSTAKGRTPGRHVGVIDILYNL